ncbi:MAG: hypothetical protein IPO67_23815 [Deltaproteobacteria bacterium]|nr:hypothetical protein [Deltaproteobacteria bacterium]
MPQTPIKSLLLLASLTPLLACSDKGAATDDTQNDTQVSAPTPYGPENAWYHAPDASLVPEEPAVDQWTLGALAPNLRFTDQNGDEVWLYQFFGQTVYINWAVEWRDTCHNYVPNLSDFNLRHNERATVITVLMEDAWFGPGDAETVARWVEKHGGADPIFWLDAEQAARVDWPTTWPRIDLIDPGVRLAQQEVNRIYADATIDQVTRRMELAIGGSLDNEAEVCGDGYDNDLDLIADCMDQACEASCAETSVTGSLAPCTPDTDDKTTRVDVWRVTVSGAVAAIESDNIAEATGFEHILYIREEGQSWSEALIAGDDEWACTWPLEDLGCARGWLPPGTWEVMVFAGTGGWPPSDGDCVNPELGEYTLRTRGDVSFTLVQDDVELQSL